MRITLARGEFVEALSRAGRALSNRTTLPLLSGVMVTAQENQVLFEATDLEVSVRTQVSADVAEPGRCVVPGRLLTDIVRSLPEAAVTLTADTEGGSVSCGTASFHLKTLPPDDFPKFPEVEPDAVVSLPAGPFGDVVKQVARAVSRDETRPILTGVLTEIEGDTLRMVATDSYRLAVRETKLDKEAAVAIEAVIPGRALEEVPRLTSDTEVISLGLGSNQVVFKVGATTFVTRRIEGTFPNYKQLIQQDTTAQATVGKDELAAAVKRVSLLAQHNAPLRLTLKPTDNTLSLAAQTQDVGDATEDLMVEAEGEQVEIAFNHTFLADGIAAVDDAELTIKLSSPLKPGTLESAAEGSFLYLLMPVRL